MQTILTHSYPDTGRYAGKLRVVDELGNAEPWRPFVVDIARPTPTPTPPQIVPSWGFSLSGHDDGETERIKFPRRYGGTSAVGMGSWSISAAPKWVQTDEISGGWFFYWSLENIPNGEEGHGYIDRDRAMIFGMIQNWYPGGATPAVTMRERDGYTWVASYPIAPPQFPTDPLETFEARFENGVLEMNEPWSITTWTGDAAAVIDPQHFRVGYLGFSTLTELNYALCEGGNLRVQFDGYTIV